MSVSKDKPPQGPTQLQGSIESLTELDDGVELAVRLSNPLGRSIHYIADVRGLIFDPKTHRLHVRLSERGMQMPSGATPIEPQFRMIDPHSESMIKIRLPKTIVKLSDRLSPDNTVVFEEHAIAEATGIELEIGWADTPYYSDSREKARGVSPISSWEQQSFRTTFIPPPKTDRPLRS
jgi:hypothetical protein